MIKKMTAITLLGLAFAGSSHAEEIALSVEVPQIDVAEYHWPYVAMWLQNVDSGDITNIKVWYQIKESDEKGEQWLKDMRQWWRRSGRSLDMPVDGISGATKKPGVHTVDMTNLKNLAAGSYKLNVEAVREVGGREMLKIPFTWPVTSAQSLEAQGETELGKIVLQLKP